MLPAQLPPRSSEERREGQVELGLALNCATPERQAASTILSITSAHQLQALVALLQLWYPQAAPSGSQCWVVLHWSSHFLSG